MITKVAMADAPPAIAAFFKRSVIVIARIKGQSADKPTKTLRNMMKSIKDYFLHNSLLIPLFIHSERSVRAHVSLFLITLCERKNSEVPHVWSKDPGYLWGVHPIAVPTIGVAHGRFGQFLWRRVVQAVHPDRDEVAADLFQVTFAEDVYALNLPEFVLHRAASESVLRQPVLALLQMGTGQATRLRSSSGFSCISSSCTCRYPWKDRCRPRRRRHRSGSFRCMSWS